MNSDVSKVYAYQITEETLENLCLGCQFMLRWTLDRGDCVADMRWQRLLTLLIKGPASIY